MGRAESSRYSIGKRCLDVVWAGFFLSLSLSSAAPAPTGEGMRLSRRVFEGLLLLLLLEKFSLKEWS